MSLVKIQNALAREFERKRVVFWYDPELIGWQQEFEALELAGVVFSAAANKLRPAR